MYGHKAFGQAFDWMLPISLFRGHTKLIASEEGGRSVKVTMYNLLLELRVTG
jgi:hypothetical protein